MKSPRTEDLIGALAGRVRGELIGPGEPGYDTARSLWNGRVDRRPALILRARGAADVIAAVDTVRTFRVPFAIRGGGHHTAGFAVCEGGLMLDLSPMNGVRVDPSCERVRVGPGARVRDVDLETQAFGLVTTGGPVSTLGMAGYTLGGGLGWTSRAHGLSSDRLISADVVTADGRLVRASEEENPDLFWALRGGGGNFGVVTSFEFRLDPLGPDVLAGPIVHPMSAAAELLAFWRDFMRTAPDQLQCMPVIFAPPAVDGSFGPTVFALVPLWAGDPVDGEAAMAPLREIGSPLADGVALARYATLLFSLDEMYRAGDRNYYRTAFFDDIPDAALAEFARRADPVPTRESSIFLEPLGGAIARRARDATAFPHRERMYCVTAVPKWQDAARDDEMIAWAERLFEPLDAYAAPGAYVNYLEGAGEAQARAAYGDHWDRLVELKRRWDPENLFRSNHNIPPA